MSCDEHHTDDVNLAFIEKKIDIVSGNEYNFKITTPDIFNCREAF